MNLLRTAPIHEGTLRNGLTSFLILSMLVSLEACSDGDGASQSPVGEATAVQLGSPPDACRLLTLEEVALATGWKSTSAHDVDTGAAFVSSCTFADGGDLARVATVSVSAGGATHKTSADFAQSVGDNGGMLTAPAIAVDEFPVPVIATRPIGGIYGMQARTPAGVELTVATWSIETTRQLFPIALTRLLANDTN